jgi:hypothetical protein
VGWAFKKALRFLRRRRDEDFLGLVEMEEQGWELAVFLVGVG